MFGPKVIRVMRGQGDQWDNRARVRGITASFSLNGVGLMPDDSPDLYQENEELKAIRNFDKIFFLIFFFLSSFSIFIFLQEEIQKLAAQIEFMKIVNMEMNNRHIKPKPGGYFTTVTALQSPVSKCTAAQTSKNSTQQNSGISEDGHSGTNSVGNNSIG